MDKKDFIKKVYEDVDILINNYLSNGLLSSYCGWENLDEFIYDKFPFLSIAYIIRTNVSIDEFNKFCTNYSSQISNEVNDLRGILLTDVDKEILSIKQNNENLHKMNEGLEDQLKNKESDLSKLKSENERLKNQIKRSEDKFKAWKEKYLKLKQTNKDLENQLKNKESDLSKLKSKNERLRPQIKDSVYEYEYKSRELKERESRASSTGRVKKFQNDNYYYNITEDNVNEVIRKFCDRYSKIEFEFEESSLTKVGLDIIGLCDFLHNCGLKAISITLIEQRRTVGELKNQILDLIRAKAKWEIYHP